MTERIRTYQEFWPFYLGEHRQTATQRIHIAGTYAGIAALAAAVATQTWWLPLAEIAAGYAAAWTAHAFIEKNRPATFSYPLWSLRSDFKMAALWSRGRLCKEMDKHKIRPEINVSRENTPSITLNYLYKTFSKAIRAARRPAARHKHEHRQIRH